MNHHASPEFWQSYRSLPVSVQRLADRCFELLKRDPRHPSLHFKKVGRFYSARLEKAFADVPEEEGVAEINRVAAEVRAEMKAERRNKKG